MVKYYRTDDKKIYEFSELTQGIWIDMINPTVSEGEEVAEKLNIELEDGYTLILIDIPTTEIRHDKEAYTTIPLGIILTADTIITVCTEETSILQAFVNGRVKEFSTKKKLRFVYQILFRVASAYQTSLRVIDKKRTEIEERIDDDTEDIDLIDLHALESTLVYFATSLRANAVVMDRLTRYKVIDNRLNNVMKTLTIVTLVMGIPTLVSGIYGMNVNSKWVPLANVPFGFGIICILILVVCAVMLIVLKKKKFL